MSNCPPSNVPCQVVDVHGDERWMSQHNHFLSDSKDHEPDVVFIGDSLVRNLQFTEIWRKMFEPLHCLNFGIGGDETQNVLWRVTNGELDSFDKPKIVVVLAGTNNYRHSAAEVANGVTAIVDVIRDKQPRSHVIVMGIPPRGEFPNELRVKDSATNDILSERLKDNRHVTFLPTDFSLFINPVDETINRKDMFDFLHLTEAGYAKLCEPLLDLIQSLIRNFVKVRGDSQDVDDDY